MLPADAMTATQPKPQSDTEWLTGAWGVSLLLFCGHHQKEFQATCGQEIQLFIWVGENARSSQRTCSRPPQWTVPKSPALG